MDPSIQRMLLSDRELRVGAGSDLAVRARALLRQQMETWPLLRAGYESLQEVETRTIELGTSIVRVQFNPARLTSSSANVDDESIRRRKCFLCAENLPREQRGILFASNYLLLCNPYPIFNEHFTISHTKHTLQRIAPSFGTMLDITRAVQARYLLLYNGPRSGASAPDHLHFQAGEKGFLPIEQDLENLLRKGTMISESAGITVRAVEAPLRRFFVLESSDRTILVGAMRKLESALASATKEKDEPMLNILSSFDQDRWWVLVFPRAKHRPSFYFAGPEERILLSPGAVDCSGILITPLEKDFRRLTAQNVREMFTEVLLSAEVFRALCDRLRSDLLRMESGGSTMR